MSLGFYVDVQRCIGCRTCQVACKRRALAPGAWEASNAGRTRRWACSI